MFSVLMGFLGFLFLGRYRQKLCFRLSLSGFGGAYGKSFAFACRAFSKGVFFPWSRRTRSVRLTPDPIRTGDLLLRRQLLYPAELPGRVSVDVSDGVNLFYWKFPVNPLLVLVSLSVFLWQEVSVGYFVGDVHVCADGESAGVGDDKVGMGVVPGAAGVAVDGAKKLVGLDDGGYDGCVVCCVVGRVVQAG